jgi:hypothetical protein
MTRVQRPTACELRDADAWATLINAQRAAAAPASLSGQPDSRKRLGRQRDLNGRAPGRPDSGVLVRHDGSSASAISIRGSDALMIDTVSPPKSGIGAGIVRGYRVCRLAATGGC